jgi:hypothetical protein
MTLGLIGVRTDGGKYGFGSTMRSATALNVVLAHSFSPTECQVELPKC